MELDGKEIKENEQLTDAQLTELHQQYQALWDKLKRTTTRLTTSLWKCCTKSLTIFKIMKRHFSPTKFAKTPVTTSLTS